MPDEKKFKPKYYARIPLGKENYRYFYSKEAYDAYLKNKKQTKDEKKENVSDKVEKTLSKTKTTVDRKSSNETKKSLTSLVGKGKELVEKVSKKIHPNDSEESSNSNDKKSESSSVSVKNIVSDMADKGKKVISDTIEKMGDTSVNAVKASEIVKSVAKKVVSWVSGGLLQVAINELVNTVKEKKQEKERAEAERKAAEEAAEEADKKKKQQEEYDKWQKEQDARWEATQRKVKEEKERKAAEKQEKELAEQQAAIDELTESGDTLPGLDIKDEPCTKDEDQKATNPYYDGTDNYGYSNNCAYCTAAYELRQRGYDVEAASVSYSDANTIDVVCDWYEGEDVETLSELFEENNIDPRKGTTYEKAADMIEDDLVKHGNGSRGQFILYWSNGGGHSVVWEVQNNEVVLRDCQNNDRVEILDYLQYANNVVYFRTDNVELSDKIVETVVNTEDGRYVEDRW